MLHKIHTGFYQWSDNPFGFIFFQSEDYHGSLGELTITKCVSRGLNFSIDDEIRKTIKTQMNLMMPIEFLNSRED